jgi:hypothetical protein
MPPLMTPRRPDMEQKVAGRAIVARLVSHRKYSSTGTSDVSEMIPTPPLMKREERVTKVVKKIPIQFPIYDEARFTVDLSSPRHSLFSPMRLQRHPDTNNSPRRVSPTRRPASIVRGDLKGLQTHREIIGVAALLMKRHASPRYQNLSKIVKDLF